METITHYDRCEWCIATAGDAEHYECISCGIERWVERADDNETSVSPRCPQCTDILDKNEWWDYRLAYQCAECGAERWVVTELD